MNTGVETARAVVVENSAETSSSASDRRPQWVRSAGVWLVVIAFAVRIGLLLGTSAYRFDRIDDFSYVNETTWIAASLTRGEGFSSPFGSEYTGPTSWVAPVYPMLCALVFAIFGAFTTKAAVALLTMQSAFSALTCLPILGIARRTAGRRAGVAAAVVWAVFPWFSKWALSWVWEVSLSALLFTCLFWYALRLCEPAERKTWVGFGALWGIALLVNPALLLLLPASLARCGYQLQRQGRKWTQSAALGLLTCLLVISPWLARNRMVLGQWVFLRSNFPVEFWVGNSQYSMGRGWIGRHPETNLVERARYQAMGEPAYGRERLHQALQWIWGSKREFLTLTAQRVKYFWDGSAIEYRVAMPWYWMSWSFAPFSFLILPAVLVAHRRRLPGWPLFLAALVLYPMPYYFTFSMARYRHVLEPLMLLLVCFAATELLTAKRSAAQ